MNRTVAALMPAILATLVWAQAPAFDVVSIKPNRTGDRNSGFRRASPGELNAVNDTVKFLIGFAYDLHDYQITGGPGWLDTDRYDIQAKSDPAPAAASQDQLRAQTRRLLADRFQLAAHTETQQGAIFILTREKVAPKGMKPSTAVRMDLVDNGHHLDCQRVTMADVVRLFLASELDRPVVDRTGLTGVYDFNLDWSADPATDLSRPSLVTALREQLGLTLQSAQGPIQHLVIDHAAKPSAN